MDRLNYHHLRYFRAVAHAGQLGVTAQKLHVSQSALSTQIKQLEDRLGHALFDRVGRRLVLTEAGRIALDHADRIFSAGEDLVATLSEAAAERRPLRVGALSTLSRNFQIQFLRPLLSDPEQGIVLRSGNTGALLEGLRTLTLDVVLTTEVPQAEDRVGYAAQKIDEQAVGLHGVAARVDYPTLRSLLEAEPVILPTDSVIRAGYENLISQLDLHPRIVAEVDDMAMVRLLAREGVGVAVAPSVVVSDELNSGWLKAAPFDLGISEPFYAVTLPRRFSHPALAEVLRRA